MAKKRKAQDFDDDKRPLIERVVDSFTVEQLARKIWENAPGKPYRDTQNANQTVPKRIGEIKQLKAEQIRHVARQVLTLETFGGERAAAKLVREIHETKQSKRLKRQEDAKATRKRIKEDKMEAWQNVQDNVQRAPYRLIEQLAKEQAILPCYLTFPSAVYEYSQGSGPYAKAFYYDGRQRALVQITACRVEAKEAREFGACLQSKQDSHYGSLSYVPAALKKKEMRNVVTSITVTLVHEQVVLHMTDAYNEKETRLAVLPPGMTVSLDLDMHSAARFERGSHLGWSHPGLLHHSCLGMILELDALLVPHVPAMLVALVPYMSLSVARVISDYVA